MALFLLLLLSSLLSKGNELHINSYGCDNGLCTLNTTCPDIALIHNNEHSCKSIEYAYKCLMGIDELQSCKNNGYNGSGTIHINHGLFNLPSQMSTTKTIEITGEGNTLTHLLYNTINNNTNTFTNIHFTSNNITFNFHHSSQITFINCSFINGTVRFTLQNEAKIVFIGCIFQNNIVNKNAMFFMGSKSSLR
eukprot:143230_1